MGSNRNKGLLLLNMTVGYKSELYNKDDDIDITDLVVTENFFFIDRESAKNKNYYLEKLIIDGSRKRYLRETQHVQLYTSVNKTRTIVAYIF